jgi:hypothetical protein
LAPVLSGATHSLPQLLLSRRRPILAIKLQEDRRVGDGHVRLEHEDVEGLSRVINLLNERLVRERFDGAIVQDFFQVLAVNADPGRGLVGDVGQLGVEVDVRRDVDGMVEGAEHDAQNLRQISAGLDSFDSRRDLERVGGVDDHDPVAVAEEREFLIELDAPVCVCFCVWGLGAGCLRGEDECERDCKDDFFHGRMSAFIPPFSLSILTDISKAGSPFLAPVL